MNPEAWHLRSVDSLRAVAALLIVAYHVAFVLGALGGEGSGAWLAQLQVGVPLFFAISGFLLYRPWVKAKLAGAPAPETRVYALRRALRILPAYWVALVIISLVLGRDGVFAWPGGLVYGVLGQAYDAGRFTGGIGQAWTLTVEVAFYVALPFLALLARRLPGLRGEVLLLCGLVALSLAWRVAVVTAVEPTDSAYFPLLVALPAELDYFAAGMALAVLSLATPDVRAPAWAAWATAFAAFALLALWTPDPTPSVLAGHELPTRRRCGAALAGRAWHSADRRPGAAAGVAAARLDRTRVLRHLPVASRRPARARGHGRARRSGRRRRAGDLRGARRCELVPHRAQRDPRRSSGPPTAARGAAPGPAGGGRRA